jgi:hypothetical protein
LIEDLEMIVMAEVGVGESWECNVGIVAGLECKRMGVDGLVLKGWLKVED